MLLIFISLFLIDHITSPISIIGVFVFSCCSAYYTYLNVEEKRQAHHLAS